MGNEQAVKTRLLGDYYPKFMDRDDVFKAMRDSLKRRKKFSEKNPQLNILILGMRGCGKSSFLNTLNTALRDRPTMEEIAAAGANDDMGHEDAHMTRRLTCYDLSDERYGDLREGLEGLESGLPRIVDMCGLENMAGGSQGKLLKQVLLGKWDFCRDAVLDLEVGEIESVEDEYDCAKGIHIIVVIVAGNEEIPDGLIKEVKKCIREIKADIRLYAVVTKIDIPLKKGSIEEKKKLVEKVESVVNKILGKGNRQKVLPMKNYCDDVCPEGKKRSDKLDLPVLKFFADIVSPTLGSNDHLTKKGGAKSANSLPGKDGDEELPN